MRLKLLWWYLYGSGSSIPVDAVIEPDGVTPLKEPNDDYVLEP